MPKLPTILIIGASRGLGLALASEYCSRDWNVIATVRSPSEYLSAVGARYPGRLTTETVDITDPNSVGKLKTRLGTTPVDILFVNAGICIARENTPIDVATTDFVELMVTNALSPMRMVEAFEDLVPGTGAIAVMSSELGSIEGNQGFWEIYSASKAALNMLMKCFAGRHAGDPRALLLIAPGWVRTEMGGPQALLSIEESIPSVVDMVENELGRPGLRFIDRNGAVLPW
ncbi:NAD(P)-dependent dehydrogenase (short-subunit alcohol dehydrogenase family) [Nitrobacteraceae bacterium AZCC 2146]